MSSSPTKLCMQKTPSLSSSPSLYKTLKTSTTISTTPPKMNHKSKIPFIFAAFLLSATLASSSRDPELRHCHQQCQSLKSAGDEQYQACLQRCDDYRRFQPGGGDEAAEFNDRSPIDRLRECNKRCEKQEQGERREGCQRLCQQEYDRERESYERREKHRGQHEYDRERESYDRRERHRGGGGSSEYQDCRRECQRGSRREKELCEQRCDESYHGHGRWNPSYEEGEERERGRREWSRSKSSSNPYVFSDEHFFTGIRSQHGRLRILQKFTERSELLRGIENFRVGIFEAQPQTFVVPNHWDADALIFVANGRGTVSVVRQEKRESYNIKEGDIFRIRAGATSYLVNKGNNEQLVLVKLYQPVNTPGEFEAFFGAGGENQNSYLQTFSNEILEAAFNVKSDRLQRVLGQQRQGAIIKASEEQIRSMSRHSESGIWPFGGESKTSHNLYDRRPIFSNEYGQYYEVEASQFRQLRGIDAAISVANISRGAMMTPYYNSKATEINVVINGEGYFEMACPHLSQSQSESRRYGRETGRREEQRETGHREEQYSQRGETGYEKVRSQLSVGTVFIVPAGHPFVAVASNNQNLQILSFKVNADYNEQFTLAGRRNVINQIEREAKELAFGTPAREVEEVFGSQQEEFFFRGPRQGRYEE